MLAAVTNQTGQILPLHDLMLHHVNRNWPVFSPQKSSICRAAVHAGVIQNESGGYLDVMPVDKRRQYSGSYQNGITSERYG